MLWFGVVGDQCFCLVLVMVGKYLALLVLYGGLLCFTGSLWFVGVVPLLALCGDSLLWFCRVSGHFPPASLFVSVIWLKLRFYSVYGDLYV